VGRRENVAKMPIVLTKSDDIVGHRHVPKRRLDHVAQEELELEHPDVAAELVRGLRDNHKQAVLMHVRGAKKTWDGRVIL
jgi:hypothetical protein